MSSNVDIDPATTFAISAVAKLTGISEHCLRIWERRYGVVEPARTETKRRRYTQHDVERLVLIKHLVDSGDTISSVATLTLEQLKERSKRYPAASPEVGTESAVVRIAIIGERMKSEVENQDSEASGLQVVAAYNSVSEFLDSPVHAGVEVVVFDFPTVHVHSVADMEQVLSASGARKGILVYGFGSRPAIDKINRDKIVPLQSPVDLHEIRIACADPNMIAATHTLKDEGGLHFIPHRYDVDDLAKIASAASKVHCECPQHLVSLVFNLNAFERYSQECESLSPEDAELHNYLYKMTSKSRAIVEEALAKVAKQDGIFP